MDVKKMVLLVTLVMTLALLAFSCKKPEAEEPIPSPPMGGVMGGVSVPETPAEEPAEEEATAPETDVMGGEAEGTTSETGGLGEATDATTSYGSETDAAGAGAPPAAAPTTPGTGM